MDDNTLTVTESEEITPVPESAVRWYESITFDDARAFIRENIASASRSFIAVGYYLKFVRDHSLHAPAGYRSVWEFASEEYGISKSTASRYMAMNDRFSRGGNSPYVAPEYKEFGKSQLQEMLYLDDAQLDQVTPEAQIKQIREMRREILTPYTGVQIPGQFSISDFPDYLPDESEQENTEETALGVPAKTVLTIDDMIDAAGSQQNDDSIAISQQEETGLYDINSCPPDIEDCRRQEWGTDQEQQKQGHEECKKCWQDWKSLKEAIEATAEPYEPEINEPIDEPESDQSTDIEPEKVIDAEFAEIPEQPELPILKNNDQRAAFVDAYETWPLWIETVETGERYYRYNLPDGNSMVIKVYHAMLFDYEVTGGKWEDRFQEGYGKHEYYLLHDDKFFRDCTVNKSYLVEYLKDMQKCKGQ